MVELAVLAAVELATHGSRRPPACARRPSRLRSRASAIGPRSVCAPSLEPLRGVAKECGLSEPLRGAPLQMPIRDAALGHSGALPAAAARAADLLRHPRGGGEGRVGDACRQAALLSGKPPDTTTTLSTPEHPSHPSHPFTTRCQPLPPPPFPTLPPLPSGVRQHASAARRRRRAETTRRARLHMVERSCPAARQPTCMRPPPPAPEARPIAQGCLPAPRAASSPCRVPTGVGGISEEPHLRWCRHPQV